MGYHQAFRSCCWSSGLNSHTNLVKYYYPYLRVLKESWFVLKLQFYLCIYIYICLSTVSQFMYLSDPVCWLVYVYLWKLGAIWHTYLASLASWCQVILEAAWVAQPALEGWVESSRIFRTVEMYTSWLQDTYFVPWFSGVPVSWMIIHTELHGWHRHGELRPKQSLSQFGQHVTKRRWRR